MEKIFGLGFSKTGTTSLETALETLGYKVCRGHWQSAHTFYLQALWAGRVYDELLKMTEYWDAFADAPWGGTTLYEQLYERYPDAKYILTVRDPEKWYVSLEKLLTMFDLNLDTAFETYHRRGMWGSHLFFKDVFGGIETLTGNRQRIIDAYNAYNDGVKRFFAARPNANFMLLDFAKNDGWSDLCSFLGKPIPPVPFPHENQSVQNPYLSNAQPPATPPERKLVVMLNIGHPNDVESARYSRRTLAQFGYELVEISLADKEAASKTLNALIAQRAAEIFCFLSDNYYALQVSGTNGALLHTLTGIPLVIMMHDHPAFFFPQQVPQLAGSIVFAPGGDAAAYVRAHYAPTITAITNTGSLPPVDAHVPDYDQFLRRNNAIFAPMNLNFGNVTLDGAWQQIKALPGARRTVATALVEAALTDTATPLHEIAARMPQLLTGDEARAALGDHAAVLVFVKLWRRTQMVRALIDLPMLISTAHVPAELELKHAKKFTTLSMNETAERYRNYRFTLNSHPGLTHLLHDRLTVAAALNSALITDANAAVQHYFQDGVHALFFDLARPDASVQQVAAHLDDPARAFALTVQAAAVRDATDHFDYREGYAKLLDFLAAHWAARGGPAPVAVPA